MNGTRATISEPTSTATEKGHGSIEESHTADPSTIADSRCGSEQRKSQVRWGVIAALQALSLSLLRLQIWKFSPDLESPVATVKKGEVWDGGLMSYLLAASFNLTTPATLHRVVGSIRPVSRFSPVLTHPWWKMSTMTWVRHLLISPGRQDDGRRF